MSLMAPLISVGVLASTSIESLDALLSSLCKQTHKNLEILIAGESLAGPALIHYLRERSAQDKRIHYVASQDCTGQDAPFLALLRRASGDFFVIALDTMHWSSNFLERCLEEIGVHGTVMCSVSVDGVPVSLPRLGGDKSKNQNVLSFISNPTAAILLGVHRTYWLKAFVQEVSYTLDLSQTLLRSVLRGHHRVFCDCLCDFSSSSRAILTEVHHLVSRGVADLIASGTADNEGFACRKREFRKALLFSMLDRLPRAAKPSLVQTSSMPEKWVETKESFSQSGEDMIIDFIFGAIQLRYPTYLDLGAHHPRLYSNTFHFYLTGSRGVNVEADPSLCELFVEERPADINLNVGVGVGDFGRLPFYVMSVPTLNTFSREEAERCVAMGTHRIDRIIDVPLRDVNSIIEEYFNGEAPDFISIDVEGLDFEIVKSLDFSRYRPVVICVETITFSENFDGKKVEEIGEYLRTQGYFLYADTQINSIFVDKGRWHH